MRKKYGPLYVTPLTVWLAAFFVIPISIIVYYSFLTKRPATGGVIHQFSLEAYTALINPLIFRIALNTFWVACVSTVIMIALAIPTAYYMARSKYKNFFLLLVIIPFLTNFLIRIYAWMAILGNNGILNNALASIGLIDSHIQFLYNVNAVILLTVYTYLPFAILPLYSTIEKFDFSLLEAARDLGATKLTAMLRILFPNIRAGITTAVLFTFIPAFGNYAIPQIIGDAGSYMLGNVIARELTVTRNWPLASSLSVVLTTLTTLGVLLFMRFNRSATEGAAAMAAAAKRRQGMRAAI
ncbi:MAG: ABC transporter permease [Chitinispirillales bacterium]|nr:ABC transporter permease [Chitinispirillales bacterium]